MKARLEGGSIVELEKDCGCIDHDGPHWLHADALARASNYSLLQLGALGAKGFAIEEEARLSRKLSIMKAKRIAELLA